MQKIDWDETWLKCAEVILVDQLKCAAKKSCCLLVRNNTIISTGVSGTLSGFINCNQLFKKIDGKWHRRNKMEAMLLKENFKSLYNQPTNETWELCEDQEEHFRWSKQNEVHAEINALGRAAQQGFSTKGSTAYIVHSPCFNCSLALATFGISRVVYRVEYDAEPDAINILKQAGISVKHLPK
jgi:dCMP deaminase